MPQPTAKRIQVYYEVLTADWSIGPIICTTEKTYFDRNNYLDDGSSGQIYEAISDAMGKSGAPETSESAFEAERPIDDVIASMRDKGFDMIKNPAFSALVLGTTDR